MLFLHLQEDICHVCSMWAGICYTLTQYNPNRPVLRFSSFLIKVLAMQGSVAVLRSITHADAYVANVYPELQYKQPALCNFPQGENIRAIDQEVHRGRCWFIHL